MPQAAGSSAIRAWGFPVHVSGTFRNFVLAIEAADLAAAKEQAAETAAGVGGAVGHELQMNGEPYELGCGCGA